MDSSADQEEQGIEVSIEHPADGVCVLHIGGDLDMLTARPLARSISVELADNCRALVLDLTDVQFLGSSGLAVLVQARNDAGEETAVVLAGKLHRAVHRSLEMVGLLEMFPLFPSVEQAVDAVG